MALNLTADERETTVTVTDGDDLVRLYSARIKDINRMRRDDRFTLVRDGFYGTSEWAEFTIPKEHYSPVTGLKRRVSDEQREKMRQQALARGFGHNNDTQRVGFVKEGDDK